MQKLHIVGGDWGLYVLISETLEIIEQFLRFKTSLDLSSSSTHEITCYMWLLLLIIQLSLSFKIFWPRSFVFSVTILRKTFFLGSLQLFVIQCILRQFFPRYSNNTLVLSLIFKIFAFQLSSNSDALYAVH